MDNSKLYRLGSNDVIKGIITAIFAGVILAVGQVGHAVVTAPGFDVFSVDWVTTLRSMVNAAIVGAEGGFVGYISKNFLSDQHGAFMGRFGGAK